MSKRRGRGEGTISQRANGRWQASITLEPDGSGQRRRKTVYGPTREAAARELNRLLGRVANTEPIPTRTPRLRDWLQDWTATHQHEWSTNTRRIYGYATSRWLAPLGGYSLEQLTPIIIQRWINAQGAHQRIKIARCVLQMALAWALKQRVLSYNAAMLTTMPTLPTAPVRRLTIDESRQLVAVLSGHRLGAMILTSLILGLRIGEASGLRWRDLDVKTRMLQVRQQVQPNEQGALALVPLKTEQSRRTLILPHVVIEALAAHRVRQLEERLQAGAAWDGAIDLVFTTPRGQMLPSNQGRYALEQLLKAAGLVHVKYHALRHTAATILLADGTPLFDVSRLLGHGRIQTTADIYGEFTSHMAAQAATRMDRMFKTRAKG